MVVKSAFVVVPLVLVGSNGGGSRNEAANAGDIVTMDSTARALRDLLFGDVPLAEWGRDVKLDAEPWLTFRRARRAVQEQKTSEAARGLVEITEMPGLESRQYLQAWSALRELGVQPGAADQFRVLGVVVEVSVGSGADVVAAFADRRARYLNHAGPVIIWEAPDHSLDNQVRDLLAAAEAAANTLPSVAARAQCTEVLLSILTAGGCRQVQGAFDAIQADPNSGSVLKAAFQLMLALQSRTRKR
jgi:hypothetical protein